MSKEKKKVVLKIPENLLHYNGAFLDCENVGSSIRYTIETKFNKKTGKPTFDAEISLSDCDRVIKWGGSDWYDGAPGFVKKIDCAIKMLKEARAATIIHMVQAEKYKGKDEEKDED